ncbi:asparagine synthase-related protein [Gramella sp. Hel_I_59]|uniref:asparagine synthase-related protein n=1 Tax=Gramella sp. Hel_I_59 TaxID=1249978 RepID=UPI001639C60A|nr:asparagine synthase-related protein [Gramella sp. Hel_I_59]
MQKDLAHRGPDRQDIYREESMFFGHMLLQVTPESIYDSSPYEEDGFVITAYARLDEREAIMDRINTHPSERETITDPLLLLRSYIKFGKDFVKDIYGDFAFAIWNKEKKELFCARDQMGVKPFLYYFENNRFVFSTELKSLVQLPFVKTEVDHLHLRDEAIGLCDAPTKTAWKNIYRLKAASYLKIDKYQILIFKYWDLNKKNKNLNTEEDWAKTLRSLLEKVIADQTRVISEVGVPLSGGLDSSTIACITARKFAKENKKIISASSVLDKNYCEPSLRDEMDYINEVIKQEKNIDPTFIYHSTLKYSLKDLFSKFDDNYAPVVHSYYLDEAIFSKFQEKSVRRMLSGVLGDITTSNSTVSPLPILMRNGSFSKFFRLSRRFRKNMNLSYYTLITRYITEPILPFFFREIVHSVLRIYKPWTILNFPLEFQDRVKKSLQKRMKDFYRKFYLDQFNIKNSIWPEEFENFGEEYDCNSSHHQIEITYPLLDRRIIEFMVQLPVEHYYMGGLKRGLIRKAMENILPDKNRLRFDKLPYSPAYKQINQNYLAKFKESLSESNYNNALISNAKLKESLENILIYDNLASTYWEVLGIYGWIQFDNWTIENKEKLVK